MFSFTQIIVKYFLSHSLRPENKISNRIVQKFPECRRTKGMNILACYLFTPVIMDGSYQKPFYPK